MRTFLFGLQRKDVEDKPLLEIAALYANGKTKL